MLAARCGSAASRATEIRADRRREAPRQSRASTRRGVRFEAVEVGDLAVAPVADVRGAEQGRRLPLGEARQEAGRTSAGSSAAGSAAPHALGFDERRGEEVVAARLPGLAVGVAAVPDVRPLPQQIAQPVVAAPLRRSRAPGVSANAVLKCVPARIGYVALRQERVESLDERVGERAQRRRPAPALVAGVPGQFAGQHQQPGPAVRPLESAAQRLRQIGHLAGDVVRREVGVEQRADLRRRGALTGTAGTAAPASSSRARRNASRSCRRTPDAARAATGRLPAPSITWSSLFGYSRETWPSAIAAKRSAMTASSVVPGAGAGAGVTVSIGRRGNT